MGLDLPPQSQLQSIFRVGTRPAWVPQATFRAINHGGLLHLVTPQDATLCNLLVDTQQLQCSMNHCLDCNRHYLPVGNLRRRLDPPMAGCWADSPLVGLLSMRGDPAVLILYWGGGGVTNTRPSQYSCTYGMYCICVCMYCTFNMYVRTMDYRSSLADGDSTANTSRHHLHYE